MLRIYMNAGASVEVDVPMNDFAKQLANFKPEDNLQFITFTKEKIMLNLNKINYIQEIEEEN